VKPPGAVRLSTRVVGVGEPIRRCAEHHRHLPRVLGGLVGLEVCRRDRTSAQPQLIGVDPGEACAWGLIGRPVARELVGWVEYTRGVVPDGAPPGCASALLGAAARWARAAGLPIVTYTLAVEPGVSLRAAGWVEVVSPHDRAAPRQWRVSGQTRAARVGPVADPKRRWVSSWSVEAAQARGWSVVSSPAGGERVAG